MSKGQTIERNSEFLNSSHKKAAQYPKRKGKCIVIFFNFKSFIHFSLCHSRRSFCPETLPNRPNSRFNLLDNIFYTDFAFERLIQNWSTIWLPAYEAGEMYRHFVWLKGFLSVFFFCYTGCPN